MPDEVLGKYKYNQHCLLCTVDLDLRSGSELSFVSTLALATMKTYSGIVCSFSTSLVVVPNS